MIATAGVLVLSHCGWEQKVVFKQSQGNAYVEIQQPFPVNGSGTRVLLYNNGSTKVLYEVRGDTFLEFADVFWSADGKDMAIYTCGVPYLELAYNLANNQSIPFPQVRTGVAAHIRSEYHLEEHNKSDKKTFLWACSQDGKIAFLRRHPEAAPR